MLSSPVRCGLDLRGYRTFGATSCSLGYGPVTRSHPEDGLVDGLQRLGFPPPCHPSYKALALTLAGLTPAERVRLRWTHNGPYGFPVSRFHKGVARGFKEGISENKRTSPYSPISLRSGRCLHLELPRFGGQLIAWHLSRLLIAPLEV